MVIMGTTPRAERFYYGALRFVIGARGAVQRIQVRNPGSIFRQQEEPQVVSPSHLMLLTCDRAVGYWELPTSGVRLNGAKVEQDDGQLIRAACQGESAAYGVLVRKYQARLCTSLNHICGSLDDAEDVAQEAFVQAYVKLRTFAGGSSFYTWLYRIAVNAAISRRRRRRERTSVDSQRDELGLEPLDHGERADERLLREERAVQVQWALGQLSDEHRTILVLREVDDCDYDEIAQILELPVGTVRSRLHRARLQLKEQLDIVLGNTTLGISPLGESKKRA
jgi:RNA polymerase sigma-70 factor, ECF subfamily